MNQTVDIELLRSKLDIVSIIEEFTPLKKNGPAYKGCCPLHPEKSPSFSVNPDKQLYHCFGCHKGGDVFSFIMEKKGLSFKDTLYELADKVGLQFEKNLFKSQLFSNHQLPPIIIENYPVILLLLQEKVAQINKMKAETQKLFDDLKKRFTLCLHTFCYDRFEATEAETKIHLYQSKFLDKIKDWADLMVEIELLQCFIDDNIIVFEKLFRESRTQKDKSNSN